MTRVTKRQQEWLDVAIRIAEEVDKAIDEDGTDIDIRWIQDRVRSIAWHCRGVSGAPGLVVPVTRPAAAQYGGDVIRASRCDGGR